MKDLKTFEREVNREARRWDIEKEILKMSEENSSLIVGDGSHLNTNKITAKELTNNYGD